MIISGETIARQIEAKLMQELRAMHADRPPKLSVVLVGEERASQIYVSMKQKSCERIGILSDTLHCPSSISEEKLVSLIQELNKNEKVDGILIQLPLPSHINTERVLSSLSPDKDIDGFHPINIGKLLLGYEDGFVPCTPLGIQQLLIHSQIPTEGKHVVIVGRSNIVGKPMAALLMQKKAHANATVTLCHSQSQQIERWTQEADILIAACGQAEFIRGSMVKEGAVVIDVGIHRREEGGLVGDVAFNEVASKVSHISPVPKGVGPMTVVMLMYNTLKSFRQRIRG